MYGKWLRKTNGNCCAVFVHGFLSNSGDAWGTMPMKSWPQLLMEEPELEKVGIYLFTYHSDIFSGDYDLSDAVDALKERLKLEKIFQSEHVIFVCHSMGGILVRKYIVDRALDLKTLDPKIGLFLVASPSLGSEYADRFKLLAGYLGHKQADALRFISNNAWLNDVHKNFRNLKESRALQISGKELVESNFIVNPKAPFLRLLLRKIMPGPIVKPFSAAAYFGESIKIAKTDHFTICKPENRDADQHLLLCEFIKEISAPIPEEGPRDGERGTRPPGADADGKSGAFQTASIFAQRGLIAPIMGELVKVENKKIIIKKAAAQDPGNLFLSDDPAITELSGKLNAQAFRFQEWAGTGVSREANILEKTMRNGSHLRKNPSVLLLLKSFAINGFPSSGQPIGFSHLIPVTSSGYDDYLAGRIEDNLLSADCICAKGEKAKAFLAFTLAVDTISLREAYVRPALLGGAQTPEALSWKCEIALKLLHLLAFHVYKMMTDQGNVDSIELLAQNDDNPGILNILEMAHFGHTGTRSKDGHLIRNIMCEREMN